MQANLSKHMPKLNLENQIAGNWKKSKFGGLKLEQIVLLQMNETNVNMSIENNDSDRTKNIYVNRALNRMALGFDGWFFNEKSNMAGTMSYSIWL